MVRNVLALDFRRVLPRLSPVLFGLHIAAMIGYCLLTIVGMDLWLPSATILTVVFFFTFSLAHLLESRGLRVGLLMFCAAFLVTLACEAIGVATGLLFGSYTYSDQLGPKVFGLVPALIPVAWFMVLYPAYAVTQFVLHGVAPGWSRRLGGWKLAILQSALAAVAMTAWDLSLDPRMVADGYWTWRDGGAYFGIPLSNFAGWMITSFTIYLLWHVIGRLATRIPASPRGGAGFDAAGDGTEGEEASLNLYRALPVLAYIVTWIGESMASALFWTGPLVGAVVFVGMGVFAAPALLLLMRRPARKLGAPMLNPIAHMHLVPVRGDEAPVIHAVAARRGPAER